MLALRSSVTHLYFIVISPTKTPTQKKKKMFTLFEWIRLNVNCWKWICWLWSAERREPWRRNSVTECQQNGRKGLCCYEFLVYLPWHTNNIKRNIKTSNWHWEIFFKKKKKLKIMLIGLFLATKLMSRENWVVSYINLYLLWLS